MLSNHLHSHCSNAPRVIQHVGILIPIQVPSIRTSNLPAGVEAPMRNNSALKQLSTGPLGKLFGAAAVRRTFLCSYITRGVMCSCCRIFGRGNTRKPSWRFCHDNKILCDDKFIFMIEGNRAFCNKGGAELQQPFPSKLTGPMSYPARTTYRSSTATTLYLRTQPYHTSKTSCAVDQCAMKENQRHNRNAHECNKCNAQLTPTRIRDTSKRHSCKVFCPYSWDRSMPVAAFAQRPLLLPHQGLGNRT